MNRIPDEIWHILTKTILPALVAVTVGLAVKMKQGKITVLNALGSYIIGLGFAFIFGFAVHDNFDTGYANIIIGGIAILGEKLGYWLIFKLDFDDLGQEFVDWLKRKLK